jgi:3-hydroxy-3-methylglutaryl CoA synthase
MSSQRVGIEKISAYPGSLVLPMAALCAARGDDLSHVRDVMLIEERSVNVEWEDPVTMAVNAAKPLLTEEDRAKIGLLVVATESGVDQEKPISAWVQRYLGLSSRVRNIEVKHACYGATASLQLAAGWVASGAAPGETALVINTDQSRMHLGKPWEYVLGAGAAAILISANPRILEIEHGRCGIYAEEVSDLTRPTAHVETGNSETSLLSYLEALDGAIDDYLRRHPDAADLDRHFQRNIYHLPFGGMGYRAHKALLRRVGITGRNEARDHFARKTLPSLEYVRRMGGTYGASTFIALMALIACDNDLRAGDRVGIFSYGSGSCAEFWSGILLPEARETVEAAGLPRLLDARLPISVPQYEAVEMARSGVVDCGDFTPDMHSLDGWYQQYYERKELLVFHGMRDYYRQYGWS